MPRPPRFTTAELLDAAASVADTAGPAAVTMTAVAKAAKAPNGSLYHRFPDRPSLLSALWLRTLESFHTDYLAVLGSDGDPREIAVAAARHVVRWCRDHPAQARILRHGAADFGKDSWPAEATARLEAANVRVFAAIGDLAERLGATDATARERVTAALIDVPYGLVNRHLRDADPIPEQSISMAEECAAALIAQRS
ncbi:TetR/AcrR family transcriptional regulator [Streptomyces sp. NPDC002851]